jgi:hypothetical protein
LIAAPFHQEINFVVEVNITGHCFFAADELVKAELDLLTLTNIINKKRLTSLFKKVIWAAELALA